MPLCKVTRLWVSKARSYFRSKSCELDLVEAESYSLYLETKLGSTDFENIKLIVQ